MKCPYDNYCNLKKIDSQRCADYENCETYKYYFNYGNNPLGVGTLMPEDISRLENEFKKSTIKIGLV